MGGANSVDRPGTTHPTSIANTYADPIVRSSRPPLNGELVANMDIREVSSAPSKVDEHRGQATTAVNSVLATFHVENEQGDQSHERRERYRPTSIYMTSSLCIILHLYFAHRINVSCTLLALTDSLAFAFSVASPKVWNGVSLSIKGFSCFKSFKHNLKTFCFKSCFHIFQPDRVGLVLLFVARSRSARTVYAFCDNFVWEGCMSSSLSLL